MTRFDSARQVVAFARFGAAPWSVGPQCARARRVVQDGFIALAPCVVFSGVDGFALESSVKSDGRGAARGGQEQDAHRKMLIVGAAMRKLLPLAFGVLKSGKPFDANFRPQPG